MKKDIQYQTLIFWEDADECYIATVPGLPLFSAHGDTPEEAARELSVALELAAEVAEEDGETFSFPDNLPALTKAAPLLNLSALARRLGLKQSTLASKIQRGTTLKPEETEALNNALRESGLALIAAEA